MIPPFDAHGNLPPGIHWAPWQEVVERFGTTPHRLDLLAGLRRALDALAAAGCRTFYLDGSFVTSKRDPLDYDGCWDIDGVDADAMDPLLLLQDLHEAGKAAYLGDLFPVRIIDGVSRSGVLELFRRDRDGNSKGIVAIDLRGMEP